MDLNFDVDIIRLTEFGVGRDLRDDDHGFYGVSSNGNVQDELVSMVRTTINALNRSETESGGPRQYSPSEKHSGNEYLTLPIDDDMAQVFSDLHSTDNLPLDPRRSISRLTYSAILQDSQTLLAVGSSGCDVQLNSRA